MPNIWYNKHEDLELSKEETKMFNTLNKADIARIENALWVLNVYHDEIVSECRNTYEHDYISYDFLSDLEDIRKMINHEPKE